MINNWIIYLVQVCLCQVAFYLFYATLLKNEKWLNLNRFYLLVSLCISFIIPAIQLNQVINNTALPPINLPEFVISQITSTPEIHTGFSFQDTLAALYIIGALVLSIRLLINLYSILKLVLSNSIEQKEGYKLIQTTNTQPASFFNYLFWNEQDDMIENEAILIHEQAHIKQWHSVDVLFAEMICIVCWFNPFSYLYKKAIQANHEFIADEAVTKHTIKSNYAEYLVSKVFYSNTVQLSNSFFIQSLLKRRIIMINKKEKKQWAKLKYALVLPLVPAMLWLNTSAQAAKKQKVKKEAVVFTKVEKMPEYPGGQEALFKYLASNITYPEKAKKENKQGKVYISFVVSDKGAIKDAKIMRGVSKEIDAEALRVVNNMPAWTPGQQGGKDVNTSFTLPISFKL